MIFVDLLSPEDLIPKGTLKILLEKEAADFLTHVRALEIPDSQDRLNLPVIVTDDKLSAQTANQTPLEHFVDSECYYVPGAMLAFAEFYERYVAQLNPNEIEQWSKNRVGREIRNNPRYPVAYKPKTAETFIGNMAWQAGQPVGQVLVARDKRLVPISEAVQT